MTTDLCEVLSVDGAEARRSHIAGLDAAGLSALRARIKAARGWGGDPLALVPRGPFGRHPNARVEKRPTSCFWLSF